MGPNSYPAGDKAEFDRLMGFVCTVHSKVEYCAKADDKCKYERLRWVLLNRGRLRTGKSRG